MDLIFRLELDKGPKTPQHPACLQIRRSPTGIEFTILDGQNNLYLAGQCEPDELFKLATMLTDGGE